jgi:hypothetical protein
MNDIALSAKSINRHPVDRLADVRAEIKALEDVEADLKAEIGKLMGTSDALGGDEFIAYQRLEARRGSLDAKKIEAAGLDPDRFRKASTTAVVLRVERRVSEAA